MSIMEDFCTEGKGPAEKEIQSLLKSVEDMELDSSAFQVKTSPEIGRYVAANRDLKEGDLIVSEAPIVLGPRSSSDLGEACIGCLQMILPKLRNIRCPRCRWPVCSENCAGLTDKHRHGAECVVLAMVKSRVGRYSPAAILPFRCFFLQNRDPERWAQLLEMATEIDRVLQKKKDPVSPNTDFLEDEILLPLSKIAPKLIPDCSEETVRKIGFLVQSHCLYLSRPNTGRVGGVTEVASVLEHSCMPNTRVYFEYPNPKEATPTDDWQGKVIVRAAKDIRKGEHLTTPFITDVMQFTLWRQHSIRSLRNTQCSCERCLDPTELGTNYGTLRCSCSGMYLPLDVGNIQSSSWQCSLTGDKLNPTQFILYFNVLLKKFQAVMNDEDLSVKRLDSLLLDILPNLHPGHCFVVLIKARLAKNIGLVDEERRLGSLSLAELERKKALCQEVLDVYSKFNTVIMSDIHSSVEVLTELVYSNMELMKRKGIEQDRKCWEKEVAHNRKLFVRAVRLFLANYTGPEEPQKTETEKQQLVFLSRATKLGFFYPIPKEFLKISMLRAM